MDDGVLDQDVPDPVLAGALEHRGRDLVLLQHDVAADGDGQVYSRFLAMRSVRAVLLLGTSKIATGSVTTVLLRLTGVQVTNVSGWRMLPFTSTLRLLP